MQMRKVHLWLHNAQHWLNLLFFLNFFPGNPVLFAHAKRPLAVAVDSVLQRNIEGSVTESWPQAVLAGFESGWSGSAQPSALFSVSSPSERSTVQG